MDNRLMHYILPDYDLQLDGTMVKLHQKIAAAVEDTTDKAIVQAVIDAAKAEGVTDLYLLDKAFILDALREKLERENPKPLTIEELKQMHGEPVYIAESNSWGIVVCDNSGYWKGIPYVSGVEPIHFLWDVKERELTCYRHKPKEEHHEV